MNLTDLDSLGGGRYRVKSSRQPRYMGANIIPLKASGGSVSVEVTASAPFGATLAVRAADKSVRYIDLTNGKGSVDLRNGEETSLVVANTPDTLYLYDPFSPISEVNRGLDYQVQITGASA